jgi:hypothetical protein
MPTPHSELTAQRLFIVAHNRNHVRISADMAQLLRDQGHGVSYAVIEQHPDREAALTAIAERGFPIVESQQLPILAGARDVVCMGSDWGPKHFVRTLARLRRNGVALVGFVEGARFAYPRHYERVDDLMCWGPSALELLPGRKHIVGSPAIEKARKPERPAPPRPRVLINYKFTRGAADEGPAWARAAAEAAATIDPDYVLSAHPFNVAELGGLNLSHAPVPALLNEATLVITRASTVIYEALAARVSVLYFPLPDDLRAEFGEPMGAFAYAEDAATLARLTRDHGADPAFDGASAQSFLDRHVSFDPQTPAPARMAAFITAKLADRAKFDPAPVPSSKLGLDEVLHWFRRRGGGNTH